MANIFLPIDEDNTWVDSPEVIRFANGDCYKKVQLSTEPDTHSWDNVEDTFNTCEDCEGVHPCQITYEAIFDCELGDFIIEPYYIDTTCETFNGCVETPWFIFEFDEENSQCIYRALVCESLEDPICETEGNPCFATESPPELIPMFCPCPESSSSSSSSSIIPESSSSSSSSSSELITGEATGPRFI